MKEEFKSRTYGDFSQRYQGTYGWFQKPAGGEILVKLIKVREESLKFQDKSGGEYTANADVGNVFSFLPTTKGAYLYGDGFVVVKRVPARQYKRGICDDNTTIYNPISFLNIPVGFEVLETVFTENIPEYIPGKIFIADKVITFSPTAVWLYENKIGKVGDGGTVVLHDKFKVFQQEVEDAIAKHSLPFGVVR